MKKLLYKIIICIFWIMYLTNTSVFAHEIIMDNHHENTSHQQEDISSIDDTDKINNKWCENDWCEKYCYNIENSKITAISNKISSWIKNIQNIVKSENFTNIYNNTNKEEWYLEKYVYNNGPPINNQKFIKFADLVWVIVLIC